MKFFLYNNILESNYTEHEVEAKTIDEAIHALNLTGSFVVLVDDKVYNYPQDKDVILDSKIPIHIKRTQKNAGTQIIAGTVLVALSFVPGLQPLMYIGSSLIAGGLVGLFAPKINTDDTTAKASYTLNGGGNSIPSIGQKYPIIFGKHKIVPPILGTYFTTLSSNTGKGEQYITGMVCLGYNELSVSNLKFGTNILSNNSADVRNGSLTIDGDTFNGSVEIRQDGTLPTIYTTKMYEEQPGVMIKENETSNFKYVYSSPPKTTSIKLFISLAGLYYIEDEGRRPAGMVINMAIRPKGSSTWNIVVSRKIQENTIDALRYFLEYSFSTAEKNANPSGEWEVALYRSSSWRCWKDGNFRKYVDNTNTNLVMTTTWDAFQCELDEVPMIADERAKMCLVAFRIKATESNTGSLDAFNCVAQRLQPAWDGINSGASGWTSYTKNSNPASAFLLALQGNHLPSAVADSRIDWTALEDLYTWCNSDNYQCNGVISEDETTRGVLDKILYTCRAYFYMKNGIYSFIHDNYQATPVCIISPSVSSNFKATKSFAEKATAMEITYYSASDDWESTSEQVYPYGESQAAGDTIDKITYWGVTNHTQVYKLARYQMAALKLRPEAYELKVGIEHFGLSLGSRVLLQHDVLSVGIDSGFIKSVDSATQLTLRNKVAYDKLDVYAISIFKQDGTIITKTIDFSGESKTYGYTDIIVIDDTTDVNVDDVFAYGISGSETIDCMVKSKSIEASPDLSATLTLIGYNEEVYEASEQAVPAYEPKTTKTQNYEIKAIGTGSTELYSSNNGNSVQDDGAVYFTFEDATIDGSTLVNMGSFKDVSDSTPTNLVRSTDSDGVWADSSGTSLIPFKIDNIFYKNFSINFFVKDLDLTTDGYIYIYDDISLSNHISLRVESGDLILQIQLKEVIVPITISGTGNSSMLSFCINFDTDLISIYENNNLIFNDPIGTSMVTAGGDQVQADGDDVIIYLATTPSNNDRDIYFNLLSSDATDGFSGSIRRFRMFGFSLESSDVDSLYNNKYLLQNILAAGRYLGELISAPTIVNQYDTFTYSGSTNVDFVNGKEYTWNGYKWIIWNL